MPPECGNNHPDFGVGCQLEKGHTQDHWHKTTNGSVLTWPQVKPKAAYTRAQLDQMIGDHEVKLQQTIDEIQSTSGLARDLINTLVPPMQTQLFLIKEVLKLVKE
jgi:hypothetical protein